MKKVQEELLGLVLQHAVGDKKGDAESLIGDAFKKLEGGELNAEHIAKLAPDLLGMIKPEHVGTIENIIGDIAKNLGK